MSQFDSMDIKKIVGLKVYIVSDSIPLLGEKKIQIQGNFTILKCKKMIQQKCMVQKRLFWQN
jgi:hypothetical protein